jgi:hypothetical protein
MNRKLFYILNLTWGLPMTLIGTIAALALIGCGKLPTNHGGCLCFTVGKKWGGVSLGLVMIVSKQATEDTKNHELGHALQNAVYGLFMPFIVSIPSAVRYWYRRTRKHSTLPPYDAVWFERQATEWGNLNIKDF